MSPEFERARIERALATCEEHAVLCNERRCRFPTLHLVCSIPPWANWVGGLGWIWLALFALVFGLAAYEFIAWTLIVRRWRKLARELEKAKEAL